MVYFVFDYKYNCAKLGETINDILVESTTYMKVDLEVPLPILAITSKPAGHTIP